MGFPYDLQKYAFSKKMTRIKVVGVMKYYFGDLELDIELDFEGHLKINIEFLNGNSLFLSRI